MAIFDRAVGRKSAAFCTFIVGLVFASPAFARLHGPDVPKVFLSDGDLLNDIRKDGISRESKIVSKIKANKLATHYSYKFGPLGATNCEDRAGFSAPVRVKEQLKLNIARTPDGDVILCLLASEVRNNLLALEQPLPSVTQYSWFKAVSVRPPSYPFVVISDTGFLADISDGSSSLTALDLTLSRRNRANAFSFKIGTAATTDCSVRSGYSALIRRSSGLTADLAGFAAGANLKLCLLGAHVDGNSNNVIQQPLATATTYTWSMSAGPDVTPPGPFSILSPAGLVNTRDPVANWQSATGADFYDILIARDATCTDIINAYTSLTATSQQLLLNFADGTYFLCMSARDVAGNTTQASNNSVSFTVDVTAPAAFSITGPVGTINDSTPDLTWSASSGASVYNGSLSSAADCSVAVQSFTTDATTVATATDLADGTYFVCVTAADPAGNTTVATNNGLAFTINTAAPTPVHKIFVSTFPGFLTNSSTFPPNFPEFGSVNDADWLCTYAAFNAGIASGWDGVSPIWRAVLSDAGINARDRLQIDGSIYNMQNQLIANNAADFFDGSIANPIAYDETGMLVEANALVWTGSNGGGMAVDTCNGWSPDGGSALVGSPHATELAWIAGASESCTSPAPRLYCISPSLAQ